MKIWVALFLFTSCHAVVIVAPKNPDDFGAAVTFNNQDNSGYNFGYKEDHPSGASFRQETGDALGNKIGSFGLRDADGRMRIVRYVADENGFRAEVTSNEPGVAPSVPASATINKPAFLPPPLVPVAPVVAPPPPPPPPVAVPARYLPPPVPYNYLPPAPVAVAPPPPPPQYYAPRYLPPPPVAPVAAPVAFPPVAIAPVAKGVAALPPPPPPPPPAYYTNLGVGKGYVSAVRNYASLVPPFAAVPPQYNYLNFKNPAALQALGIPL